MDLQDLLFVSIALFVFSAFVCKKSSASCVVFALTSFLVIGTMAVREAASRVDEDFQRNREATNESKDVREEQSYIWAPTNPKYGKESEEEQNQNDINGRVIEVEPIRFDTFESDLSFRGLIPNLI